ncbi:hypothetical protein [Mucilaginibacter sp. L3T2-6]|uniref:hypothetical protein n=1 Tax=Mucilaginibacter sp. L3T2-6 TaxID=3062491 RepID=UPI002675BE2F|nr:hypothetical protein [Mucilaginibacter sp. L3T2-6]MDO3645332.1 hypothetical protein [Mucilaginibacter sp. L3T2-6]MDV6217837.1 hypothetical protein [Mucilaginibacter sp. L3T2-6]
MNPPAREWLHAGGPYGFTPVFNHVFARSRAVNYFVASSLPNRFGNSDPYSIGLNLQLGFTFNYLVKDGFSTLYANREDN